MEKEQREEETRSGVRGGGEGGVGDNLVVLLFLSFLFLDCSILFSPVTLLMCPDDVINPPSPPSMHFNQ